MEWAPEDRGKSQKTHCSRLLVVSPTGRETEKCRFHECNSRPGAAHSQTDFATPTLERVVRYPYQYQRLERFVNEPETDEEFAQFASPFSFSLYNLIWLTAAAVVTLALVALKVMGVIR